MRTVGSLTQVTLDVEDVEHGTEFWSRLTGLPASPSATPTERAGLAPADVTDGGPSLEIRRSTSPKGSPPNRGHLDITVTDIDVALAQVETLGGNRKIEPSVYPRPHSPIPGPVQIDWVVATDPSGNEFCLIRGIEDVERDALAAAAGVRDVAPDAHWREVIHLVRYPDGTTPPITDPQALPGKGIGTVRCCVINVDDLAVAQQFWSQLIGVPPISSEWPFRFAYLGQEDDRTMTWQHQLILQKAEKASGDEPDRVHYDITVDDLEVAMSQVMWLGGKVVRPPGHEAALTRLHAGEVHTRAIMSDRAGNQFCLVCAQ